MPYDRGEAAVNRSKISINPVIASEIAVCMQAVADIQPCLSFPATGEVYAFFSIY